MFKAFIEAIQLLYEIVAGAKALAAFVSANKEEAWFKESSKAFTFLRATVNDKTITDAERSARLRIAGRNIRDLLNRL